LNWNSIKIWWFDPTTKRLGYAVVLSALMHVLLIEQSDWVVFSNITLPFNAINAELVTTKPTQEKVLDTPPIQESKQAKVETEVAPKPPKNEDEWRPADNALAEPAEDQPESVTQELPAQDDVTSMASDSLAEQALVLPDTQLETEMPAPFTTVETDFDVLLNGGKARVGTAKIYYAKSHNQHYELTWKVSATGLVGILYPDLLQMSQGKVTETGLRPDYYLYKFGEREDKSYQASFNWIDNELALQNTKGTKTLPLQIDVKPGYTQDILSFMYQFMFAPPLDEMQMYLTNGKKFSQYDYVFEGEETLELKFASVNTYHIQHAKTDSDEKTELWLAVDYRYVPVKIKKTEKDGTVIEQIATKLKFETIENETPLP
jgi:hypothetical protein